MTILTCCVHDLYPETMPPTPEIVQKHPTHSPVGDVGNYAIASADENPSMTMENGTDTPRQSSILNCGNFHLFIFLLL